MELGNQILFFLAGLGVFNGFLMAVYILFILRPRRWINLLFGLLMLMLCVRVGKSLLHVFTDLDRIYLQLGLSACILIGPLLFLYVKSAMSKVSRPSQLGLAHLLIPIFTITLVGVIWPYARYPDIWNGYVVGGIYIWWTLYTLAAGVITIPVVKKVAREESTITERWLVLVVSCLLLLNIAYNLAYQGFPYVAGPLLFSLIFYVLTGFLLRKKNFFAVLNQTSSSQQNQKLSDEKANDLIKRLSELMRTEESYLDQNIKLTNLAVSIDATPHEVSHVINDRLGVSFNHYINEFRIKKACVLLEQSDHLTIEGIGQEAGFKSRSAFYKAFKNFMNQTPSQYKSQIKRSEEGSCP